MSARPYRILIVEDNPEDRAVYRRRITEGRERDYLFWETGSGEEGLRLCREVAPDCLLLDYQLPDLDGLEFLDRFVAEVGGADISVIMLTGHGSEAVAVQAMKKGAHDYLVKGLNSAGLRQAVQSALDKGVLRRQIEEQRRELERLTAERLRLIADLQQQTEALSEANQRKDEFLAMLAHELRNPLAPIRNALHVLRLRGGDGKTVEQMRQMIDRQIGHMSHLVEDLLDVSRITRGKIALRTERLNLAKLVSQNAEDHQPAFQAARLALHLDLPETPVWVAADATRLTQVLDNLLTNAVKFTNPGGAVTVTLTVDSAHREAVLTVRDTGIGIEPEMLPRLFDTFAQADKSLDRSRGGLGLGLTLVKSLVEFHGGRVEAASEGIGRGAEFTVRLSLEEKLPALSAAPVTPGAPRKHLHILVVEDNRDAADSLRMLLELFGHEVTVAYSGTEGLQAAKARRPDVVLCDIGLPGMDGFAVAKALREDPQTAAARLLAVTGYGREEDKEQALQAGFNGYLIKPVDPDKLLGQLASGELERP